jgi:hypothetical protein
MELDADQMGPHALQYLRARQLAHDFIDTDQKWIMKVHKKTLGFYNPDHATCTLQQTKVGNAEAGPSSAGNAHMHNLNNDTEEALSTLGDEDDEDNQMGPA